MYVNFPISRIVQCIRVRKTLSLEFNISLYVIVCTLSDISMIKYMQARTVLPDFSNEQLVVRDWLVLVHKQQKVLGLSIMNSNRVYYIL